MITSVAQGLLPCGWVRVEEATARRAPLPNYSHGYVLFCAWNWSCFLFCAIMFCCLILVSARCITTIPSFPLSFNHYVHLWILFLLFLSLVGVKASLFPPLHNPSSLLATLGVFFCGSRLPTPSHLRPPPPALPWAKRSWFMPSWVQTVIKKKKKERKDVAKVIHCGLKHEKKTIWKSDHDNTLFHWPSMQNRRHLQR